MTTVVFRFDKAALTTMTKSPDGLLGRWMQTRGRIVQLAAIRDWPDIARFLRWIADKPADFHAATRRGRRV